MRDVSSDDRFYLKLQQKNGSIFKLFWGSRNLKICLVGFKLGRRLLAQHSGMLNAVNTDLSPVVPHGYLRSMGGQVHARYRRSFAGALQDDLVESCVDQCRDLARLELTRMTGSKPADSAANSLTETLNQISTRSLFRLVFGVQPPSSFANRLYDLYCRLGPHGYIEDVEQRQSALYAEIRAQISQIQSAVPHDSASEFGDSVLRRLVAESADAELDETILGNTIFMVERGRHDFRDLLRWIVKYLSDNPTTVEEIRAEKEPVCGRLSLAQACVMETLRLDQAETINRQATEAFDFEGYHVPMNSWVSVLMRETHRDADVFDDPDCFRPQRFIEKSYTADEYSPFGLDAHQCIASHFVLRISAVFVEEIANGFRWEVTGDGHRHWGHFHWQPSQSFAIKLAEN